MPLSLIGQRFGMLVVRAPAAAQQVGAESVRHWLLHCDCGNDPELPEPALVTGRVISCGCSRVQRSGQGSSTTVFRIWQGMHQRCSNPDNVAYADYGGQGITVCPEWRSFEQFLLDMGPRPTGGVLQRFDKSGPYRADNCHWAVPSAPPGSRGELQLTHEGRSMTLSQWAAEAGLSRSSLTYRLNAGWPMDKALYTPPGRRAGGGDSAFSEDSGYTSPDGPGADNGGSDKGP